MSLFRFGLVAVFLPVVLSCTNNSPKEDGIDKEPGTISSYNFSTPVDKWVLPDELIEISGMVKLDSNKMLAIEDMHPLLYVLKLENGKGSILDTMSFKSTAKEKFDIEDVAMINDTVYALWSHGAIFKISDWKSNRVVTEIKTGLHKDNNTEGLAFDPVTGNLLVACKNEGEEDEKKSSRAIYEFDVKSQALNPAPFLIIHKKELDRLKGEKIDFYPSAIAVHPVTHDVYVISTRANKCIVQFTHDGQLKGFEYLDKSMLPQPEGICFDQEGNLYISSEGRHGQSACIYEYIQSNN